MATTDPARTPPGARLSELFEEHGRMVYGLCRVLLRNADEAEDAAQQVFLSAHRNMLSGTEPREPAAWLGTIARNECRVRIRARMTTPLALVEDRDTVAIDVEHVAAQRAEMEALCAALAELPQQQRQAIVLREFYGLSYEEVQAALGITDAAVESLLFRARKRLQAELRPARVASGALALPIALRDAVAGAVPGFSSGSGAGGVLAKLASLPLVAKLAATAATLTAAGTIGYAGLEGRDHDPAGSARNPGIEHAHPGIAKDDSSTAGTVAASKRGAPGGGGEERAGGQEDEQADNEAQGGGAEGGDDGAQVEASEDEDTTGSGGSDEPAEHTGSDSDDSSSGPSGDED